MKVELERLRRIILGRVTEQEKSKADKSQSAKSLFQMLYTEEGLNNTKEYFLRKSKGNPYLDENQFFNISIKLTDFNDIETLQVFDTFDRKQAGTMELREFFLLISMLAAREEGQTTEFLYLHSKEIFDILNSSSAPSKALSFERFARLGFVIGIPEEYLALKLKEFNVCTSDPLDFETFNLCYFDILCQLDNFRRKNSEGDSGPEKRCTIC